MSLFAASNAGLGLSEADNVTNDFLRALSQPLLIQTPLQMMLETLFLRSREQGAALLGAQQSLHSLAVENTALKQSLSQHEYKSQLELQDLRKLCLANQDKFNYLDHGLLGDLQQEHQKQQEWISGVERQVKDCQGTAHELQDKLQRVEPCLDKLGQKLQGVENIVGHHVAVSEMAEMLGIHISQAKVALRSSSSAASQQYQLMQPMQQQQQLISQHHLANSVLSAALQPNAHTSSAAAGTGHAPKHAQQAVSSMDAAETAPAEAPVLALSGTGGMEQLGGAGARAHSESPTSIGRTSSIAGLLPQLKVQVEVLEDKELEMNLHVEMLRDDMSILKKELLEARSQVTEATSITGNIDGRFHMLESEMSGVWKKLQEEAVRPRSGKVNQGQTRVQGQRGQSGQEPQSRAGPGDARPLTFADLQAIQDQLRASLEAIQDLKAGLDRSDARITKVQSTCLAATNKTTHDSEATFAKIQTHVSTLEHNVTGLQQKVNKAAATLEASKDETSKHIDLLTDLMRKVKHKLGAEDVERIMQHAAAAAQAAMQQAVQSASDKDRSLAGASRYRCLSCDTDLRMQQNVQPPKPVAKSGLFALLDGAAGQEPLALPPLAPLSAKPTDFGVIDRTISNSSQHGRASDPGAYTVPPSQTEEPLSSSLVAGRPESSITSLPFALRGNVAAPRSLATRIPTAATDAPSLTEEEVRMPASGLPRQIEGIVTGDRRSPVFRHMAVTKGAWQAPVSKERPGTPVFMT